ncbi:hypothetical protein U6A24_12650 [Aquimarina gracilis]|uniref:Uncharacterized protein n=1 Tax=Aquimarina gracilis TaxID=874422 RepID=A0ABU5ZWR9_9FLAO|nr:hypothetical protein [Aquimarina gracilis]MEB3346319.1 hypothetical protein [Aquimarina gracilis]
MQTLKNLSLITLAWTFLKSVSAILSSELQGLIEQQRVRLTDHTIFVRKNITGASSNFDVIDATTEKIDGVSSIKGTRLTKNQAVVFSQIALGYAEADPNKEGGATYGSTNIAALRNATFVITQNNREVVSIPVADLLRPSGTSLSSSEKYYKLGGLAFLVDDEEMEWQLKFPAGESMPAPAAGKAHYLEVFIKGFKTIKNIG